jgi:transposase
MGQTIMCGTDAHDKRLVSRIAAGKGKATTCIISNTTGGRMKLFGKLKELASEHGAERIAMVYEASGLGFGLYDDAMEAEIECHVLAPSKIRKRDDERRRKTDKRDAQMLLETLRGYVLGGNDLPSVWVPDEQTRDDREIVRMRLGIGSEVTRTKNQIQALLRRAREKRPKEVGEAWSGSHRLWLRTLRLSHGSQVVLQVLLRRLKSLEMEEKRMKKCLERLAKTKRYARAVEELLKLKGVGLLTAMVFLTEMGDLSRFKNRNRVGAYIGLAPGSNESGENDEKKGHITRDGSTRLRHVLCQAAWVHLRYDRREEKIFNRILRGNEKRKKIAIVATMRRLAIKMWHIGLNAQAEAGTFQEAI